MNPLQQLIRRKDENEETYFKLVSEFLLQEYYVLINGDKYELMDIELYYKGPSSDDKHTHQHDFPHGLFRAHAAGIDLTLRESKLYFGGVLIKGVYKNDNDIFNKNFDVNYEIMKSLQKPGNGVKWEKQVPVLNNDIVGTNRVNLGAGDDTTKDKPWRYVLNNPLYIKEMPGKERFVRENSEYFKGEHIKKYLGYSIEL